MFMLSALVTLLAASLETPHHVSLIQLRQGGPHRFAEARRLTDHASTEGSASGTQPLAALFDPPTLGLVTVGQQRSCPEACKCSSSSGPDGLAVNAEGYCEAACSQVHNFGFVQKRFCGDGEHYRLGAFEDCTGCAASSTESAESTESTESTTSTEIATSTAPEFEASTGKCATVSGDTSLKRYKPTDDLDQEGCESLCAESWCQAYAVKNGKCFLFPASAATDPGSEIWASKDGNIATITSGNGDEDWTCMMKKRIFEEFVGKCRNSNGDPSKRYKKAGIDSAACENLCAESWCQAYAVGPLAADPSDVKCVLFPASDETDPGEPEGFYTNGASAEDDHDIPITRVWRTNGNNAFRCMKRIEYKPVMGKCRDSDGEKLRKYYKSSGMDQGSCEALCTQDWCQAYAYNPPNGEKCILYPRSGKTDPGMPAGEGWNENTRAYGAVAQGSGEDVAICMMRI